MSSRIFKEMRLLSATRMLLALMFPFFYIYHFGHVSSAMAAMFFLILVPMSIPIIIQWGQLLFPLYYELVKLRTRRTTLERLDFKEKAPTLFQIA